MSSLDVKGLGVASWKLDGDWRHWLAVATKANLQYLHVDIGGGRRGPFLGDADTTAAFKDAMAHTGLSVSCVTANQLNDIGLVQTHQEHHYTLAKNLVLALFAFAKALDCTTVCFPSFRESTIRGHESLNITAQFISEMAEIAADEQITIVSENALSVKENQTLIKKVNKPNFGLLFDYYNSTLFGHDPIDIMDSLWEHFYSDIHIKSGTHGQMGNCALSEKSDALQRIISHLIELNFGGALVLENNYMASIDLNSDIEFINYCIGEGKFTDSLASEPKC